MSDKRQTAALLNDDEIENLTGFFDILIQMDLVQPGGDQNDNN